MISIENRPPRWRRDLAKGFELGELNDRIRVWQEIIGIPGWEVRLSLEGPGKDPDGENKRASVEIDCIHRRGAMMLDNNMPASQVDRSIVHELLHVLFAEMEDTFRRGLSEHGGEVRAFFEGQWSRSQEWVIERLTSLVSGTVREEWTPHGSAPNATWESAFPVTA